MAYVSLPLPRRSRTDAVHRCSAKDRVCNKFRIRKLQRLIKKPPSFAKSGFDPRQLVVVATAALKALKDPPQEPMMMLATLNLGRGAVAKSAEAIAACGDTPPQVLAFHNLDLNRFSCIPYAQDWKRPGYHCILGPGETTRVDVVASCPFAPISLPGLRDNDRVLAGLCEFVYQGKIFKTVLGSIYAHVDDEVQAFDLVPWVVDVYTRSAIRGCCSVTSTLT